MLYTTQCVAEQRKFYFMYSGINTSMENTRLMAKARNEVTKQTLMHRNLGSDNFHPSQRKLAEDFADQYARKLSQRTGELWTGYVEEYVPGIFKA